MAQHSLERRVQAVAAHARWLRSLYAASWIVATLVGSVVVWGLIDYFVHVSEAGVRAIASAAIVLVTTLVAWRYAWPAWRAPAGMLAVAQQIERRFPELGDRLSSSLAFLNEHDEGALSGSPALRRAVVADTMARTEQLNFFDAIDPRATRRMGAIAAAVLLIAVSLVLADPAAARLVVQRTAWPWTSAAWPRRHQLVIENAPERLATGSDFEVTVVDAQGQLPEAVTIHYWFEGDEPGKVQRRDMKLLGGKMVHRLEGVSRSFRYRVEGGDDHTMSWHELLVLEPPRIVSLEAEVTPPDYTGWPRTTSSPDLQALAGSRVALRGVVDKPIKSATLQVDGTEEPIEAPITVSTDGLSFRLSATGDHPWILAQGTGYGFAFTDVEGLEGGTTQRYELRIVPDRPPTVVVEQPADNTLVTREAILPVRVLVKDDLAVARVEIKYLRSDQSDAGEQTVELFAGPEKVSPVAKSPLATGSLAGESRLVEFAWNLKEIPDLASGVTLTWHVAAYDYKPQAGISSAQRLAIISHDELEDRIAQRQNAVLLALQDLLRREQDARSQVMGLATQLDAVGRLGKQDLDQLQSVELEQRHVARGLASESEGVLAQVAALLAELDSNRVDSPDVVRRMRSLRDELRRLAGSPLPAVERALINALKVVRDDLDRRGDVSLESSSTSADPAARSATAESLAAAGAGQDEVITSLERLLGDLEEWDNYRRFAREISRLRGDQQGLAKETQKVQAETLSKSVRDLAPQELAALRRTAQRQTELGRQLDKLLSRMGDARQKLAESQPLAAATLADALEAARDNGISSQMLETARSIERNQLGVATQEQQRLEASLSELLDILSGRKEHELERRLTQMRESAAEMSSLQKQLADTRAKTAAAAQTKNEAERKRQLERLAKEQQRIAEETERLARRLERLQAERSSQTTSAAGQKSGDAGQANAQDNAQQALDDLAQAEELLEQARQQLQQEIAQAQQDLFFEQVARLEQAIDGLVKRQQTVLRETVRLESLKQNQDGEWTPSQRTSVRSLVDQQRDLMAETTTFLEQLADAQAFALALEGAVREMTRAAGRLDRFLTDADTQTAEQIALTRLEQLLEALKPEPPADMNDQPPPPPGDPSQNGPQLPPGDALHLLAELKLMKLLQEEIHRRTTELEALRVGGALPPEKNQELADLAAEQGKLADLVLELSEKVARQAAAQAEAADSGPDNESPDNTPPRTNNPLDDELEKSLDSELLP